MKALAAKVEANDEVLDLAQEIWSELLRSREHPFRRRSEKDVQNMHAYCLHHAGEYLGKQITLNDFVVAMADSDHNGLDKQKASGAINQAGKNWIEPFVRIPKTEAGANDESKHVTKFVRQLCHKLNFDSDEKMTAEDMAIELVKKSLHSDSKPASIAGFIIWVCSLLRERKVDFKLLEEYSVKRRTLLKTYRKLHSNLRELATLENKFGKWEEYCNKLRAP